MMCDVAPKFSASELRMQKLSEYLAAKGRLKPPNPKPYLPYKNDPKGTVSKSHCQGEGKENHEPKTSVLPQKVNRKTFTQVAKNSISSHSATSKVPPRTQLSATAPAAQHAVTRHLACRLNPSSSKTSLKPASTTVTSRNSQRLPNSLPNTTGHYQGSQPVRTKTAWQSQPLHSSVLSRGCPRAVLIPKTHGPARNLPDATSSNVKSQKMPLKPEARELGRRVIGRTPRVSAAKAPCSEAPKPAACRTAPPAREMKLTQQASTHRAPPLKPERCKVQSRMYRGLAQPNLPGNGTSVKSNLSRSAGLSQASVSHMPRTTAKPDVSASPRPVPLCSAKPSGAALPSDTQAGAAVPRLKSWTLSTTKMPQPWRPTAKATAGPVAPVSLFKGSHRASSTAQTLPRLTRANNQPAGQLELRTPKPGDKAGLQTAKTAPVQGKNRSTAAQEERLQKLQEWRAAKGITYKRPPMPIRQQARKTVALPDRYWVAMEEEEEIHSLICTVDRSLDDCLKLIQQGCPPEQVRDVLSRVPMAQKFAKYWVCLARLKECEGDFNVLPLFEEAVRIVREPVDNLRSVIFEILKKKESQGTSPSRTETGGDKPGIEEQRNDPTFTPQTVRVLIRGERGGSSVVKYKITSTPGGLRSERREPVRVEGQEVRFFTPVRRSVRIEKSARRYPTALQEHDPCVTSCGDLLAEENNDDKEKSSPASPRSSPLYIYRENDALKDQVHVKLLFSEETDAE